MSTPNPADEPSMEEILASIRRIISDGEDGAGDAAQSGMSDDPGPDVFGAAPTTEAAPAAEGPQPATESAPAEPEEADILELTEDMSMEATNEAPAESAAAGMTPTAPKEPEVVFGGHRETAGPAQEPPADDAASEAGAESPTEGVRASANGADPHTDTADHEHLLSPTADAHVTAAFGKLANTMLTQDARTLEDLVQEMLRPMLREWLDDNLPQLVERLVRAEIERVSRGKS